MLESAGDMRARIMAIARELYVLRGYEGFSFGDIAEVVTTTRANIHHHYGTKQRLMGELIDGFVADAEARIARHWTEGQATFSERLAHQVEDLRRFYERFNKTRASATSGARSRVSASTCPIARRPRRWSRWSARPRLRRGPAPRDPRGGRSRRARRRGRDAGLVRLLRVSLLSCPPMTQDAGAFRDRRTVRRDRAPDRARS